MYCDLTMHLSPNSRPSPLGTQQDLLTPLICCAASRDPSPPVSGIQRCSSASLRSGCSARDSSLLTYAVSPHASCRPTRSVRVRSNKTSLGGDLTARALPSLVRSTPSPASYVACSRPVYHAVQQCYDLTRRYCAPGSTPASASVQSVRGQGGGCSYTSMQPAELFRALRYLSLLTQRCIRPSTRRGEESVKSTG